ncbi:MAG: tetratricopeptide repeat protein [Gemmatimonadota bacterium]
MSRRRPGLAGPAVLIALVAVACSGSAAPTQECPPDLDSVVTQGWDSYRSGSLEAAAEAFRTADVCAPERPDAMNGLAYVALRRDSAAIARDLFDQVLQSSPQDVDALAGRALVAVRDGDRDRAAGLFRKVLDLQPEHAEAREYVDQLEAYTSLPDRGPPPVRPDSTLYPARTRADRFEIRTAEGWEPFYIKGVNLGAALPGKHPSQFPDSATYAGWIAGMAEMSVNVIRVYTIHPPHFYQALYEHNTANPDEALWLMHGVWAELPPHGDYLDPEWEAGFFDEMRRVVDLLHGWAVIPRMPGHTSGRYTADVSAWTLAYLIGREWEPFSVIEFNERYPELREWHGRYLKLSDGLPMDAWLAKACEEMIAYEMSTFRAQRPVAYTNWPTLDPQNHPTETTVEEELRLRRGLGERVERIPREYDNDAVGLDASLVRPTDEFPAGYYAAFHAYPYYPDFMALDPEYREGRGPEGPSNYFAYLASLKEALPGLPVVIAEYGVPASIGIAHLEPQGWHHGGHDEEAMARINARLTREIADAGMAGGALFAWIDEWFKKNWIVIDFEIPLDRNRLWLNRMDAEQHYGVVAMEAGLAPAGDTFEERQRTWRDVPALYRNEGGPTLRALADEAYLWLAVELEQNAGADEVLIGFDTLEPEKGDFEWPGREAPSSPVGLEFALRLTPGEARLLVDPASNPIRVDTVRQGLDSARLRTPGLLTTPPPGSFAGRLEACYRRPLQTVANDDGRYDSMRVVTNRPRFTKSGIEFAAMGYDRGLLRSGPPPDGLWEWDVDGGVIEVRIPWTLLNVTDPSQRRVLADQGDVADPCSGNGHVEFGTRTVGDFRVVAVVRTGPGEWRSLPASGSAADAAVFTWPTWEEPTWRSRRRPAFDEMRAVFDGLAPAVMHEEKHR